MPAVGKRIGFFLSVSGKKEHLEEWEKCHRFLHEKLLQQECKNMNR
jgi:hypothetical protein